MLRILFFVIISLSRLFAQDEKTFRDILLHQENKKDPLKKVHVKTRSKRYVIDLNSDGKKDSFYTSKEDGKDIMTFFNHKKVKVFSHAFESHGPWGRIFKVQIRKISKETDVMLIYFYEGLNRYIDTLGTARVYFLTIDNKDFKTLSMFKGPLVWTEKKDRKENYFKRKYDVTLYDYDNNDRREVSVKFRGVSRVFAYEGLGQWLERTNKYNSLKSKRKI